MGLFDDKEKYLIDVMGVATIVKVGYSRYDDIYNEPTIMYHITYEYSNRKTASSRRHPVRMTCKTGLMNTPGQSRGWSSTRSKLRRRASSTRTERRHPTSTPWFQTRPRLCACRTRRSPTSTTRSCARRRPSAER